MKNFSLRLILLALTLVIVLLVFPACNESDSDDGGDGGNDSQSSSSIGGGLTPGGSEDESSSGNGGVVNTDPFKATVYFNSNGGTEVSAVIVNKNSTVVAPDSPTREGYTFDGWYSNDEKWVFSTNTVSKDTTLTAKWIANENLLSFAPNGAVGTMTSLTIATDEKTTLPSISFEKPGYTFMGWATSPSGSVEFADGAEYKMGPNQSYVLFAVWEANINDLRLMANDGSNEAVVMKIKTGSSYALVGDSFTRAGYDIIGWSNTEDGDVDYEIGDVYVMGDLPTYTLYAVWDISTNDIVLNMNDGTAAKQTLNVKSFETCSLPLNTYARMGYKFEGWSLTPDGAISYIDGGTFKSGTDKVFNLYAVWSTIEYTITYNNAPDLLVTEIKYTVEELPLKLPKLNNTSDTLFECWYPSSGLTGTPIATLTEVGDYDLYPSFVEGTDGLVLVDVGEEWTVAGYTGEKDVHVVIPSYFQGKPVTVIGEDAFSGGNYLTGVTLPSQLEKICDGAFLSCHSIEYIEIPSTVTVIEAQAFVYCRGLQSIIIPAGVKEIGRRTFYDCQSLEAVIIYGATEIKSEAFMNCYALTDITLPSSLKKIDDEAFRNCEALVGIEIPSGVTSLGEMAFYGCDILETVVLPNTITSIDENAFGFCKKLKQINLPTGLTKIENDTFNYCLALSSIEIPSGVKTIDDSAFEECRALEEITIPDAVTTIGDNAFYYCISLETVSISSTSKLTSIGDGAFYDCKSLISISLPSNLASIGSSAFYNCSSLIQIGIPKSVTSVGADAFKNCTKLYIYCEADSRPISWSAKWNSSDRSVFWGQVL